MSKLARTGAGGRRRPAPRVDLSVRVGPVALRAPVLTAAGTAGHGAELRDHVDLSSLGAVVVKSLSAEPWPGNPPPRVHEAGDGMINSVGLQNGGVAAWRVEELPELIRAGAAVVASIWGFTVADYEAAALALADAPADVVAVEVNLSCPNTEAGRHMFAHDPLLTADALRAAAAAARPLWAKLSPNVTELVPIAAAAQEAGASAVTLINTVMGMVIDVEGRRPVLGAGGGGVSGPPVHPVAVRAVWDVHAALPDLPIVGVGGVSRGVDAVELLLAGASAVEVGTATFRHPRAVENVLHEVAEWCEAHGVTAVSELTGAAHA